jgi:hypothetical protein
MKRGIEMVLLCLITAVSTNCFADCNCDDWVNRGGYCVDYVKAKIPTFPVPKTVAEITALKNKETSKVAEGDVAIFDLGKYWHVAYVEKVHWDPQGNATAIDVSEMNFGGHMSFREYKRKWSPKNVSEWKRTLCCGVTKKYDQMSMRKNIALNSVEQIWSPVSAASQENSGGHESDDLMDKVREALNQFIQFTGREL